MLIEVFKDIFKDKAIELGYEEEINDMQYKNKNGDNLILIGFNISMEVIKKINKQNEYINTKLDKYIEDINKPMP